MAGLAVFAIASLAPSAVDARSGASDASAKKTTKPRAKRKKAHASKVTAAKKKRKKAKSLLDRASALKFTPKRSRRHPFASGYSPPAHEFYVNEGELPPPLQSGSCPADMANVDNRYCVDRYEGSLVERGADGSEREWPASAVPEERVFVAVSRPNVYPQSSISGAMAKVACENAGKRLCKPVEWRKACGGSQGSTWSYGTARVARQCNDQGKSPMLHFYPEVNKSWTLVGMEEMNDPRLNRWDGTVARSGEFDGCVNDYGIHDMVGNLHEWTSDPNGTFQGGYYLDVQINGDGCMYRTTAHEFAYHDYSTGFRCCKDVEEGEDGSPKTLLDDSSVD